MDCCVPDLNEFDELCNYLLSNDDFPQQQPNQMTENFVSFAQPKPTLPLPIGDLTVPVDFGLQNTTTNTNFVNDVCESLASSPLALDFPSFDVLLGTSALDAKENNKLVQNNKLAQDARWTEDLLTMPLVQLNRHIKLTHMSEEDAKELKAARRRRKNRVYAKRSRQKRSHTFSELEVTHKETTSTHSALLSEVQTLRSENEALKKQEEALLRVLVRSGLSAEKIAALVPSPAV